MQPVMDYVSSDTQDLIARYRRSRQRAVLTAVAACFLAIGVVVGVSISQETKRVKAGDKEVNSELSSAFVEIARQVEPAVVNISTVATPKKAKRELEMLPITRPSFDSAVPF